MKQKVLLGIFLLGVFACASMLNSHSIQARVRSSMIVSTEWLGQHLNDKSLVLLHVGDKKDYDTAHIPGAQFIQTSDISTPRGTGLSLELPPVEQLKVIFEKFGVTDN